MRSFAATKTPNKLSSSATPIRILTSKVPGLRNVSSGWRYASAKNRLCSRVRRVLAAPNAAHALVASVVQEIGTNRHQTTRCVRVAQWPKTRAVPEDRRHQRQKWRTRWLLTSGLAAAQCKRTSTSEPDRRIPAINRLSLEYRDYALEELLFQFQTHTHTHTFDTLSRPRMTNALKQRLDLMTGPAAARRRARAGGGGSPRSPRLECAP